MNTLSSLPVQDTPQISESQIRTHLEAVNRKLALQDLQAIPINTSDWIVVSEVAHMHTSSISSYISELSDSIEGENNQRELKRKKLQKDLDSALAELAELKKRFEQGGYKQNHAAINELKKQLRDRSERSPKRQQLLDQLTPLEEIERQLNLMERSILDSDLNLSQRRANLQKIPKNIPNNFIDEVERNLKAIRIQQMKVIHIQEPENPREQKKKPKNIGIRIAAAVAIIVGGFLINTENKGIPRKNKSEHPTLPEGVVKKSLMLTKFADQICGAFENYIKNPKNLDATSCTQYLAEMIASRGGKIQGEGLVLKDAKFVKTLLELNNGKLEFSINCSYTIEDVSGNKFPEDAKIKIHLHGRLPWPERIETNLTQDTKLKNTFEMAFLGQCQERFPPNNIFGLNIRGVKVLDQISHPESRTSRLKIEFETNKGAIVLEKDSKIKE